LLTIFQATVPTNIKLQTDGRMSGLGKAQEHLLSIKETNMGHHKVAGQAHSTEQILSIHTNNEKLKDPKNLANVFNISFHQLLNNH